MPEERRSSKRKRLLLDATWESMSGTNEARVDDLSVGGCFVNTVAHVELNEMVKLDIQFPSGEWLSLRGQVASHQRGVGFGLSFTSLSDEEVVRLLKMLSAVEDKSF